MYEANLLTIILSTLGFIGFGGMLTLGGFVWKLADRLVRIESDAAQAKAQCLQALQMIDKQTTELQGFKINVHDKFVTQDAIAALEERVIEAINRLADRLDRIIDKRG